MSFVLGMFVWFTHYIYPKALFIYSPVNRKIYFKSIPAPFVSAGQQKNSRGAAAVENDDCRAPARGYCLIFARACFKCSRCFSVALRGGIILIHFFGKT